MGDFRETHRHPRRRATILVRLGRAVRVGALVVLTTFVTFVAAEVALTVGYDLFFRSSLYTYDREMGFRVRAHAAWGDERTNEFGFNDGDHVRAKPRGVTRVVLLGDSFNWAGGSQRNYTAFMRQLLAGAGASGVEVINAGYPGTHPGEELVALRRYALQYDPDIVVLGFFVGNDILDADPWRRVVPIGGELTPIDTRTDLITMVGGRPFVWRSHLRRLAEAWLGAWRRRGPHGLTIPDEAYWAIERDRMRVADPTDAGLASNERYVLAAVTAMQTLLRARGVRFVVAAYPAAFQVDGALHRRVLARFGLDERRFDWERPQRRLAEFCTERGIEFIDLLPAFRGAYDAGAELYLHNEPHWNDAGNQLAAHLLVDALGLK